MIDELIERIASAIHKAFEYHSFNGATTDEVKRPWAEARRFPPYEDKVLNAAKAALSAIRETHAIVPREPDVDMVRAGINYRMTSNITTNWYDNTVELYKAMIEAGEVK